MRDAVLVEGRESGEHVGDRVDNVLLPQRAGVVQDLRQRAAVDELHRQPALGRVQRQHAHDVRVRQAAVCKHKLLLSPRVLRRSAPELLDGNHAAVASAHAVHDGMRSPPELDARVLCARRPQAAVQHACCVSSLLRFDQF